MNEQHFDIQDMMERATKMQLAKVGKKVKIALTPSPKSLYVSSDKDIAIRIVTNLVSNAAKFTMKGSFNL